MQRTLRTSSASLASRQAAVVSGAVPDAVSALKAILPVVVIISHDTLAGPV